MGTKTRSTAPTSRLLRPIDVAVRTNRSVTWVYKSLKTGKLEGVRVGSGQLVTEASVEAWEHRDENRLSLEERCQEAAHLMLTTAIDNGWIDPEPSHETLARVARHLRNVQAHGERVA